MQGPSGLSRQIRRLVLCAGLVAALGGALRAEDLGPGFRERTFRDENGDHKYFVFVPAAYTPLQKWPLLVFLHGSGERGDPRLAVIGGIGPQIKARAETFPFIVVFPFCEDRDCRATLGWRVDGPDAKRALKIVDEVEGGIGAWSIAAATPSRWSAVVPVSATGDLSTAASLAHTPIWAFHGAKDVLVTPDDAKRMVDAVSAAGGRAYLTLLPSVRHNALHVVYNDDALYQWMLNPQSEPRPESFVENASRPATTSSTGRDFQQAFIPGVEIPQGMLVQMDRETLGSIAETLPDLVPANALSSHAAGTSESRPGLLGRIQVTVSGIGYRGSLERVVIVPRDGGWLSVSLALRNLIAEVSSAEVRGRLLAADAGPMDIVVGQYRPVWLKFDVRPVVVSRRIRFELGSREFQIPDDDFHVSTPQVTGRGIPILRNRFSSNVASNLVSGAYGRRSEFEQKVRDAVPTLVGRMEQALESKLSTTRVLGMCPSPALQPRFRLWPEGVHVDHSGVSLVLGVAIAQPGVYAVERPVRRLEQERVIFETLEIRRGLTVALSSDLIEGLTASVIDVGAAEMGTSDLPISEFDAFQDPAAITKALPDLARYGANLRVRARLRAVEPVTLRRVENDSLERVASSGDRALDYDVKLPHVALLIDVKTSPGQAEWAPCAVFDLSLNQRLKTSLELPNFSQRIFNMKRSGPAQITAQARFAEGYRALDSTLHAEVIAELFRNAWKFGEKGSVLEGMTLPDRAIGTDNLRVADVNSIGHFIAMRYVPALTRITNETSEPVVYQIRAPHSEWGGPYTLKPQQSHDYSLPYPLILQSTAGGQDQPLPMGTHFVFGKDDRGAPPPSMTSLGRAESLRN
jgi:hypothetical protein